MQWEDGARAKRGRNMKSLHLRDISNVDGGRVYRPLGRVAVVLLTLAVSLFTADRALAVCRFKAVAESGRQVVVAAAQPLYNNGHEIEVRLWARLQLIHSVERIDDA